MRGEGDASGAQRRAARGDSEASGRHDSRSPSESATPPIGSLCLTSLTV